MFFLHGEKSYVFVGFRKYCVAFHNVFLYYQASSPKSSYSLCLRLSHSLSTSLLALFECVRPCRWLLKVKVSPIFHAICLGLAMCSLSLSGLFALACPHTTANYITQTEEKWKREWQKRKRKRNETKKKEANSSSRSRIGRMLCAALSRIFSGSLWLSSLKVGCTLEWKPLWALFAAGSLSETLRSSPWAWPTNFCLYLRCSPKKQLSWVRTCRGSGRGWGRKRAVKGNDKKGSNPQCVGGVRHV